jgi:hypothetical protein
VYWVSEIGNWGLQGYWLGSIREMWMGEWCVATTGTEMSQTMGLTGRGKVSGAGLGSEGVRWLAEARRSEWEARGSGRWGGMVMEAPSFVTIS